MTPGYRMTTSQALDLLRAYGYRATAFAGTITVQEPVVTLGVNGAPSTLSHRPLTLSPAGVHRFIVDRT